MSDPVSPLAGERLGWVRNIIATPVSPVECVITAVATVTAVAVTAIAPAATIVSWLRKPWEGVVASWDRENAGSLGRLSAAWNGPVDGLGNGGSEVNHLVSTLAGAGDVGKVWAGSNSDGLSLGSNDLGRSSQSEGEGISACARSNPFGRDRGGSGR